MGFCKKCGKPINDEYLYCYQCNLTAKTYKDENGYERYKDSNLLVHRINAEKKLGRSLEPGEVVHHKDRDKLNNQKNNLWVFHSQDEHDNAHQVDAERFGPEASFKGFKNRTRRRSSY